MAIAERKTQTCSKRPTCKSISAYPELEKDITDWLSEKRKSVVAVSINVIRLKALSIAQNTNIKDFKAFVRWCNAFLERHGVSIRRRTTVAQKLPQDYEDKLINFQRFHCIAKRKQHNYELRYIGNADQTPMTFDIVANSTVYKKGSKTVSILTTGQKKDRFTVMLACLGDGTKLTPYVVFKRKKLPKMTFPKGVIVRCQQKGWMDEAMIKDWLKTVWSKVGGLRKTKSLLVSCPLIASNKENCNVVEHRNSSDPWRHDRNASAP